MVGVFRDEEGAMEESTRSHKVQILYEDIGVAPFLGQSTAGKLRVQ